MTDRADLLELIDRAPGSLRTLQGQWQSWLRVEQVHGTPMIVVSSGGDPPPRPEIIEETTQLWIELPDRWRIVSRRSPSSGFTSLDISEGVTHWTGTTGQLTSFDPSHGLMSSGPPFEEQLFPAAMLGWLHLDDLTAAEREGRRVWIVRARLRVGEAARNFAPPQPYLTRGAEHSYTIDAETGIVLHHEASVDGELCVREELTGIVVDEPIDPALFHPPDEAEVKSYTEQQLAILEANGVDTSGIDRADPQAIRRRASVTADARGRWSRRRALDHRRDTLPRRWTSCRARSTRTSSTRRQG